MVRRVSGPSLGEEKKGVTRGCQRSSSCSSLGDGRERARTLDKDKGGLLVLLINSLFKTTLLNLESVLLWRNLYSFTKSFR